jgi:hypothetical protein
MSIHNWLKEQKQIIVSENIEEFNSLDIFFDGSFIIGMVKLIGVKEVEKHFDQIMSTNISGETRLSLVGVKWSLLMGSQTIAIACDHGRKKLQKRDQWIAETKEFARSHGKDIPDYPR